MSVMYNDCKYISSKLELYTNTIRSFTCQKAACLPRKTLDGRERGICFLLVNRRLH